MSFELQNPGFFSDDVSEGNGSDTMDQDLVSEDNDDSLFDDATEHPAPKANSPIFEPTDDDPPEEFEASPLFEPESITTTPSNRTEHNLDELRRARAIKRDIQTNISVLKPKRRGRGRKPVELDAENILIKKLRQDENMEWGAIAHILNAERRRNGEAPTFTAPAVYGRFVRNGPRIAVAMGEVGFDPHDYMHLRHPKRFPSVEIGGFGGRARKRVREENVGRELGGNVREFMKGDEAGAELEQAEKTELLMQAVATIERNFWVFVADELQRTTGTMYDPKAIESRYHMV